MTMKESPPSPKRDLMLGVHLTKRDLVAFLNALPEDLFRFILITAQLIHEDGGAVTRLTFRTYREEDRYEEVCKLLTEICSPPPTNPKESAAS